MTLDEALERIDRLAESDATVEACDLVDELETDYAGDGETLGLRLSLRHALEALVAAFRQLDAITIERDEARAELQKIGRKAFWAAKEREHA